MNKKLILGSVPSVMFLLTMFVSSTFAWFTDFAVNQGNRVQSGNLVVGFTASDQLNEDNSNLGGNIQDLKVSIDPVFNLGNAAQPGDSQEKYLRIRNEGNIAINYQVDFIVTIDSKLAEVILFDIQPLGGTTQTVAGTVIDAGVYISLRDTNPDTGGLLRPSPEVPQEYEIWRVKMRFSQNAGNTYNDPNLVFQVDVRLSVWQFNNYNIETFPLGLFEKQTRQVIAGLNATFRMNNRFEILATGNNDNGNLGTGNLISNSQFQTISFINQAGTNLLNNGEFIAKVSSHGFHTLVLTNQYRVFGFGLGNEGQVGDGFLGNVTVPRLINTANLSSNEYFVDIHAGHRYSLGLTNFGEIYAWGANFNYYRAMGVANPSIAQGIPVKIDYGVSLLTNEKFVELDIGYSHAIARTNFNRIFAFGTNSYGRLGDGTTTDRPIPVLVSLPSILTGEIPTNVFASNGASYVLTNLGRVYAFGSSFSGELGINSSTWSLSPVLVNLEALQVGEQVIRLFIGHSTMFLMTNLNQVYAWGLNTNYQIGDNNNTNVLTPKHIQFQLNTNETIVNISSGNQHTVANTNMFRYFAWGANNHYQLGDLTTTTRRTPTLIDF
jgi:alpha-tubulin suppressor-like RCC1 family protein